MQKCYNVMVTGKVQDIGLRSLIGEQKGALIEDIKKEEIPYHIYLPQRFIRLYTDELADTNRKLDVGIGILKDIKSDTSALPEINSKFDSFITEQKEHNHRLGKILERLAER